ncbi:polysaccharide biosynthesis/export family protein [Microvirga sp. M2]|uniref:polysaccharide biosynthesis/export family protein n=1 Tax=Microvirga sp. M2 TaxID=3073270 RepID=UPI0039C32F1B
MSMRVLKARWALLATMLLSAQFVPTAASAAYRLGAGDVLQIAVFGLTDYNRRVTVNVDGDISVPFVGELHAFGLSLPELRAALAKSLESSGAVRNPQVTIELVEHRPFYISGDVAKPGAHPYLPGLTVRHAVALAGGVDAVRFHSGNPMLLAPDLESEHSSAWLELVKSQARLISLQAEVNDTEDADFSVLSNAPVNQTLVNRIVDLERRNLRDRLSVYRKEVAFLNSAIGATQERAGVLASSVEQQTAFVRRQEEIIERVAGNLARGVSSQMRVDEESRTMAYLKGQQTEAEARAAQGQKELRDLQHNLEKSKDERQVRLSQELQQTSILVGKIQSQIGSASEKLLVAGRLKAQLRTGASGPEFIIHRKSDDGLRSIPSTADTELEPGDVLEVVVDTDPVAMR